MSENVKKEWKDYTQEERIQSFNNYVEFNIRNAVNNNFKIWETPQKDNQKLRPYNALTGRFHEGINSIMLEIEAKKRGYSDSGWISREQGEKFGLTLKDDERGVKVAYLKRTELRPKFKLDENGQRLPLLDENGIQKINSKGEKLYQFETEFQKDKDGKIKRDKNNNPYWQYKMEQVQLEKPVLETIYLYHTSQFVNLKKEQIVKPNLKNNSTEIKRAIITANLYDKTKEEIKNYLESQQKTFANLAKEKEVDKKLEQKQTKTKSKGRGR